MLFQLKELAAAGCAIELLALLWSAESPTIRAALDDLRGAGVGVICIHRRVWRSAPARWISICAAWARLFAVLRTDPGAVVHLHLDLRFSPWIAWAAGCRRTVISVHNDEPVYRTRPWRTMLRAVDRITSHWVGISEHVRDYFCEAAGLAADRMTAISYGVVPPPPSMLRRADLGLPEEGFVVGFVGRLVPQKNLFAMLEAMQRHREVWCVLVGGGDQRAELEARACALSLERIRFTGPLPEGAAAMPLFDLFCLPSRWEGLGLVLVEAMMQGVPIAASRCGAIPEILGDGRYGCLFEPTAEGIAEAIAWVHAHPEESRAMAQQAALSAIERFSPARMTSETLAVYRRVGDGAPL